MSINSKQAKQIDLLAYLSAKGFRPTNYSNGDEVYVASPFRPKESKPSFAVNTDKNIWFDHGRGEGGNIIDLVIKLENCSVKEALIELSRFSHISSRKVKPVQINQKKLFNQNTITVDRVLPLSHHVLEKYLIQDRCLNIELCRKYLKTIFYQNKGRNKLFAVGFQNRKQHWELRSSLFKGCSGEKDISIYENTNSKNIFVFESWSDFLSLLTWRKKTHLDGITVVLNGTAMVKKAIEYIQPKSYTDIYTFLDNDQGGQTTNDKLKEALPFATIKTQNHLYKDFQDLNEWWSNTSKHSGC